MRLPKEATHVRFVLPKSPFELDGPLVVPVEAGADNR